MKAAQGRSECIVTPDEKLVSLGYPLDRKLSPAAIYKPVVIDGTTAYV